MNTTEFAIDCVPNMFLLEKYRVDSFKHWPFDESNPCNVHKMAEAGFYWCGNVKENDTVSCFVCEKILDGWEASDDPWIEHTKHAPQCLFVKIAKSEKELTVEEFYNVFGSVIKNQLNKKLNSTKKKFRSVAEKEMDKFLKS